MKKKKQASRSRHRFILRDAGVPDVDLLVRHRREMWKDVGMRKKQALDEADRVYRKWVKSGFRNGSLLGWIVETKKGVVAGSGCMWLRPVLPRPNLKAQIQPYLLSMYTERSFRRKGVASMVMREAIKWCRRNRHSRLALHASPHGRKLYRKQGFARTWEMRLRLLRTARL